jgi:hypothetical protein
MQETAHNLLQARRPEYKKPRRFPLHCRKISLVYLDRHTQGAFYYAIFILTALAAQIRMSLVASSLDPMWVGDPSDERLGP